MSELSEYSIIFKNDKEAYKFAQGLYCFKHSRNKYLNKEFKELFEKVMVQINTQYDIRQKNKKLKESGTKIKPTNQKVEQQEWFISED